MDSKYLKEAIMRIKQMPRNEQIKMLFCHHYFKHGSKTCEYCSLNLMDGMTITEGGFKLWDIIG